MSMTSKDGPTNPTPDQRLVGRANDGTPVDREAAVVGENTPQNSEMPTTVICANCQSETHYAGPESVCEHCGKNLAGSTPTPESDAVPIEHPDAHPASAAVSASTPTGSGFTQAVYTDAELSTYLAGLDAADLEKLAEDEGVDLPDHPDADVSRQMLTSALEDHYKSQRPGPQDARTAGEGGQPPNDVSISASTVPPNQVAAQQPRGTGNPSNERVGDDADANTPLDTISASTSGNETSPPPGFEVAYLAHGTRGEQERQAREDEARSSDEMSRPRVTASRGNVPGVPVYNVDDTVVHNPIRMTPDYSDLDDGSPEVFGESHDDRILRLRRERYAKDHPGEEEPDLGTHDMQDRPRRALVPEGSIPANANEVPPTPEPDPKPAPQQRTAGRPATKAASQRKAAETPSAQVSPQSRGRG